MQPEMFSGSERREYFLNSLYFIYFQVFNNYPSERTNDGLVLIAEKAQP